MATPSASPFLLGVNYPWLDYAEDFGSGPRGHLGVSSPQKYGRVKTDFARMRECGLRVVRWFLFGDGRGGFLSRNGIPQKPDDFLFSDIAAALRLAQAHDIKLCLSLIDYLWLQDRERPQTPQRYESVLQFAAGREALLANVLIPVFSEFREHPALFAWEVANEPEWAIREFHRKPVAKMHLADVRAYAAEIVQAIHELGGSAATLGSASLLWLRAWSELNLDFYQAHYYPSGNIAGNPKFPEQLAALLPLDKPLWLGELPARDVSVSEYSLERALNHCHEAALCGVAVWRWTQPEPAGRDVSIGAVEPELLQSWIASKREQGSSV